MKTTAQKLKAVAAVFVLAAAAPSFAASAPLDAQQQVLKANCVADGQPLSERVGFCQCLAEMFKGLSGFTTPNGPARDAILVRSAQSCVNARRL